MSEAAQVLRSPHRLHGVFLLVGSHGGWRASEVRKVPPLVDGRTESPPGSWVRAACLRAGLPAPVPQVEVVRDGVFLARVDLAWPEQRVIAEYEGAYHFDGLRIPLDDVRLARSVAAGWRVIRVAAHDRRDMDALVARIAEALRAGRSPRWLPVQEVTKAGRWPRVVSSDIAERCSVTCQTDHNS